MLTCSLNYYLFQLVTVLLVKLLLIVELSLYSHNSHHCGSNAAWTTEPSHLNLSIDLTCPATLPPTPPGPPPTHQPDQGPLQPLHGAVHLTHQGPLHVYPVDFLL